MPPRGVRIMGTILSTLVARAPWLWPLLKRPTHKFWNRMASEWHGRASPERVEALEAGARAVPGAPQQILEVGSGTGDGTAVLMQLFPDARIVGSDLSEEMVRVAQETNPGPEYVVADAAKLPFPDDSFDLAVQLNVPFYPRELKRVVKPDGYILVASTFGPVTPYYTPHSFLRRKLTEVGSGKAGRGDWFIGTSS
jgi:ubiquinone/menaquinone biosynthesis C-methylase UbiE